MTSHSSLEEYNHLNRNIHKMQLHDINEDDHGQRINPKDNLLHLTQQVSNEELKQAIRHELKRLLSDHERHILMLEHRSEILEQEYENLQLTDDSYQRRYEKAVREMQFFKRKYDKAVEINKQFQGFNGGRPRSPSLESSLSQENRHNNPYSSPPPIPSSPPPSSFSGSEGASFIYNTFPPPLPNSPTLDVSKSTHRQLSRSSSSSTSSSNSGTPYWTAFSADLAPTPNLPRGRQNSNTGMASIHSNSTDGESKSSSILQGRKGSWQQLQLPNSGLVPVNSLSTPSSPPTPSLNRVIPQSAPASPYVIQQRKVDPLVFGGSDALWDTISKSKTSDSTIEKMISNFLKRGGSPNTAKQSSSNKLVKYGYGMLHTLVVMKAISSMNLLLEHGANPNAMSLSQVDADKVTPAYLAAGLGWLQGLEVLVEAGADVTLSRGAGLKNKTPLHVAAENCHISVVEYIVSITPPKFHLQVDSAGKVRRRRMGFSL
ncbi:hypothetical protein BDB01DRAFT_52011 [Pilobolus umbonatus]|nr:hypothetical protein BDB01DRAFT_52011 [Pilobolus umbonatus]